MKNFMEKMRHRPQCLNFSYEPDLRHVRLKALGLCLNSLTAFENLVKSLNDFGLTKAKLPQSQ
jgi:hypothetical protein